MPRDIVGYEGEGRARRQIYRDEAIDTSPLGGVPVGSPEAAAAIARVAGVKAAETYGRTDYPKASVLNGARRHQEVMATRRAAITEPESTPAPPPPEDHAMEPLPEPPPLPEYVPGSSDPYDALIEATQAAREAGLEERFSRARLDAAVAARRLAEAAMQAAWELIHATETAIVEGLLEDAEDARQIETAETGQWVPSTPTDASTNMQGNMPWPGEAEASVALDEHPDGARTVKPSAAKRQPGRHPGKAKEAEEKAERARRVMEAMGRLGGDQRAVAAELGMKVNAVAMVVKHANLRAAQA